MATNNIQTIFGRKFKFPSKHIHNKMKKKVCCGSLKNSERVVSVQRKFEGEHIYLNIWDISEKKKILLRRGSCGN